MKRRTFLKFLGLAPALPAVAKVAADKGTGPCPPHSTPTSRARTRAREDG